MIEAEDAAQLAGEMSYVVAPSLASEASEVAEVFSYLCRGHAEVCAELVGAGDLDAASFHLGQDACVYGQSLDDHFGRVRLRGCGPGGVSVPAWRHLEWGRRKNVGRLSGPDFMLKCVPCITNEAEGQPVWDEVGSR